MALALRHFSVWTGSLIWILFNWIALCRLEISSKNSWKMPERTSVTLKSTSSRRLTKPLRASEGCLENLNRTTKATKIKSMPQKAKERIFKLKKSSFLTKSKPWSRMRLSIFAIQVTKIYLHVLMYWQSKRIELRERSRSSLQIATPSRTWSRIYEQRIGRLGPCTTYQPTSEFKSTK